MLSVEEIRTIAGYNAAGSEVAGGHVGLRQLFHLAGGTTAHAWHTALKRDGTERLLGWKAVFEWLAEFRSAERMLLRMSYRTATPDQVWDEAHAMNEKRMRA